MEGAARRATDDDAGPRTAFGVRAMRLAATGALLLAPACLDLSAPTDGIESISALITPFPAVVAGDTLRDSLGIARRLDLLAFTGRGDTVRDPEGLRFFITETGSGARIENGFLIAGDETGSIQLVGQVPGLQTPPVTIQVTPRPILVRAEPAASGDTVTLPLKQYGFVATVTSDPLSVRVIGAPGGTTPVNGWIVRYRITRQPAGVSPTALVAYLVNDQNRALRGDSLSAIDTTASGVASRRIVLRPDSLRRLTDT
ncbi:MAG: hypothetical protein H0X64_14370, partial [Gemmatimonadaceae bacterium]|nr:hypothetical protein [Gemmatimonadaceae bacterium]